MGANAGRPVRVAADRRSQPLEGLVSAAVILAGAAVYALLLSSGLVGFQATPLLCGVIAILAGLAGVRRRVVGTGLVLAGWGSAVLLVDRGVVPSTRTTPAFMLGIGAGLVVAAAVAPRAERGAWLTSGAVAACTGPLALYLTYDVAAVGRWPLWAVALLGWSAWEAWWGRRDARAPAPEGQCNSAPA